jgi:hypothetical protein
MADEVRKVLFKLEIDTGSTTAQIKALTDSTEKQTEATKKTTEAIKAEEQSIAGLRAKNKQLTAERNATSTATEAGRARIKALNDELDKNNKTIKENVDAYTKQKIGVGDYTGALDKLVPGLGATTMGIKGMITSSLAFIATPIGAVIGALGLAIAALTAYFKGSEEGQNRLNKIMSIGGILMEKVMDIAEGLGEALFNAFENPKKALSDLYEFIKNNLINRFTALGVILEGIKNLDFKQVANGVLQLTTGVEDVIGKVQKLGEEIIDTANEAVKQGSRLADLAAEIDKKERSLVVERARVSLEVSKLRAKSIQEEGDVKKATIEEAIRLETQLSDKEVAIARIRLENARLIVEAKGDDKKALNDLAKAEADLLAAEEARYSATFKFEKELEKLRDDEKKKKEKEEEDRLKAEQEKKDQEQKDREEQAKLEAEQAENNRKFLEEKEKEAAEKLIEIEKMKSGVISGLVSKVTKEKIDGQKLYNTIFKKGAAKELLATTKLAAAAAYKSLAGIPVIGPTLGAVAYAAVYAKGLLDIAGINAIPFARGGRTLSGTRINSTHGIPINRSNGDNLLATVKTGEVILNEDHQRKLGGAKTFARIGVPGFADSGFTGNETQIAVNDFNSTQALIDIGKAIAMQSPKVLIYEEFEAKQAEVNGIRNKAELV